MIVTPHRRVVQFARAPAKRAGGHSQENPLESYSCSGRVAQLGEHLLCKHAVISPKSLNRRHLTVQTPLLVGLLIGLQTIRIRCPRLYGHSEKWTPRTSDASRSVTPPENMPARTLQRVSGPLQHQSASRCNGPQSFPSC